MSSTLRPITVPRIDGTGANPIVGVEGLLAVGPGKEILHALSKAVGIATLELLSSVTAGLLAPKGADWTNVILAEYMELYEDSAAIFALVWDGRTRALVAHGAALSSYANPSTALVAHIRTADGFKRLGLGSLITREIVSAAFERGATWVVLATDDKLNRLQVGERAAPAMYRRLGFSLMAQKELADTVDWLMIVSKGDFLTHSGPREGDVLALAPGSVENAKAARSKPVVDEVHGKLSAEDDGLAIEPLSSGDLAHLFLLLNLSPAEDLQIKLFPWGVHYGPEIEREFIASVRPSLADKDRLRDGTLVLRGGDGHIRAVCAAHLQKPLSSYNYAIDFYCSPVLLGSRPDLIRELVQRTIERIRCSRTKCPLTRLSFWGVDAAKIEVFGALGFAATGEAIALFDAASRSHILAREYTYSLPDRPSS